MSKFPALTGVASTLPLPNTAPTPEVGETVKASDVQLAVQALLNQDATLEATISNGTQEINVGVLRIAARQVLPRPPRPATLSDADHDISINDANIYYLTAAPAAKRTITLLSTAESEPFEEESIELLTDGVTGVGYDYDIVREDSTVIAKFYGTNTVSNPTFATVRCWARFDFVGGVWRLGPHSAAIGGAVTDVGGVIGGPGA